MQTSSILLMGFDQSFGVRSGFSLRFSLVLGPQKLYFLKLKVLGGHSLFNREPIVVANESAHDRIVETGVSRKQINDASQIETSTSKHAIKATVISAITADDAL